MAGNVKDFGKMFPNLYCSVVKYSHMKPTRLAGLESVI